MELHPPSDREFLILDAYEELARAVCPPCIEEQPEIAQEIKETVVTSAAELQRRQAHADHNDLLNAIAAWIAEARRAGMKRRVFPKYLYLHTRVWEDDVAPGNADLLETMQIEVIHSPALPRESFHLTATYHPVSEIASYLRQYDALPKQA